MSMNLYVGNLSSETTESELKDLFAQFGEVESAKIITDRHSGNPKGFGFVEMSSRSEGEKAITELNGKLVHNREIAVNRARPKKPRRGFDGGGRGRF
jgi:RNA recognition motif-containing protein